jgi:two-component system phosphate regulon sensor histidine kinase PhoR
MVISLNALRHQVFAAGMAVALPFLVVMALVGWRLHASWHVRHSGQNLIVQAGLLAIHPDLLLTDHDRLNAAAQDWAARGGFRVTIIDETGAVLAETGRSVNGMVPHNERPEVVEALAHGSAAARRFSATLQDEVLYGAARFETSAGRRGVVRLAVPLSEVRAQAGPFRQRLLLATLVCVGLIGLLGLALSRRVARPIQAAVAAAEGLSLSEPTPPLPRFRQDEAARLSAQIHRLTEALQDQLRLTREQAAESEAILSGMVEGVLAVDARQRVRRINAAACRLLGV